MRYFLSFCSLMLSLLVSVGVVQAEDGVISRSEWGADETLRYADSPVWQMRQTAYLEYLQSPKTQTQLDAINAENTRFEFIQKYLGISAELVERRYSEN